MDEASLKWFKSSLSAAGNCVEVADLGGGGVGVRNSREPGVILRYTADEWQAFIGGVHRGEFDKPE